MNSSTIKNYGSRAILGSACVLAAFAVADTGCAKQAAKNEKTCSGAQALTGTPLTGASMKLKELSLTFDDGPGARTIELSRYLKEQGIRVTFFVWGQAVQNDGSGSTLQALVDDGHLVANHTMHHFSLTANEPTPLNDDQVVAELTEVDGLINPVVKNNFWLFRPPYGQWNDHVADVLSKSTMKKYVGPVLWNIGGSMGPNQAADAECWKPEVNKSVQDCGDLYLKEIDAVGKGIVLLHDPYFLDMNNPESGGTYQMIQYIVPILKSKGYTFKRLDEVPDVAKLLPAGVGGGGDAGTSSSSGTTTDTNGTDPANGNGAGDNPCP